MELYPHITPYLSEIERMMQDDLGSQDPRVYGMLVPFISRGGKRIRPALALLSCGAAGGEYASVLKTAAIIEMFHNFTLIHDDIEDESQFRRGKPTLHVSHGVAVALNSGDALYTLLWKELASLPVRPSRLVRLQRICADAFKRVVEGQGIEISWIRENRFDVTEKEYLHMIGGKTSALMGLSCEVGAFLAPCRASQRKALLQFGELLGTAFQIHDDVLNLTGSFDKYQKEIGGDISEGKRTLMVVHCLSCASRADRGRLVAILSSHSRNPADIREAIAILERSGSVHYAREKAGNLVLEAKKLLDRLPDTGDRRSLSAIADYVIARER